MPTPVALTPQIPAVAGVVLTYAAASANGNTFPNNGQKLVHIKNGGSSITVTPTATKTLAGLTITGTPITVAAGEKLIGPFPTDYFNDASGNVTLQFSDVTSVTIAIVDEPHVA